MTDQDNRLGRRVDGWRVPPRPEGAAMAGKYVRVQALDANLHAAELYGQYAGNDAVWDYLPYGPFTSLAGYHRWIRDAAEGNDPYFYVIIDSETKQSRGVASYLRIAPEAGSIEVGHICMAPSLQRTRAATEAIYLMMEWAFEAGYRRFEWKCNALNMASRRAAERLGLSYEGVFRQAAVVKGRNRDTAWFAAIDTEWPALREAFGTWLNPDNFDARGRQIERLSDLTRLVRQTCDPAL